VQFQPIRALNFAFGEAVQVCNLFVNGCHLRLERC